MWKIHGFPTKMIYTWWVSISIYTSLQEGNEGLVTTSVLEAALRLLLQTVYGAVLSPEKEQLHTWNCRVNNLYYSDFLNPLGCHFWHFFYVFFFYDFFLICRYGFFRVEKMTYDFFYGFEYVFFDDLFVDGKMTYDFLWFC